MAYRSDPALIEACRAGNEEAWSELVDLYARLVHSIPRRYRMTDADADEVSQAVFTILFRKLDSIDDTTRLSAWLITTTHRECWRVSRASIRRAEVEAIIDDVSAPDDDQAAIWETQHLVRRALDELGGRCKDLLQALFATANPDYDLIALKLDMPRGSIGPTRARCFGKLEAILRQHGYEDPSEAADA